jgi:hypothetical protein
MHSYLEALQFLFWCCTKPIHTSRSVDVFKHTPHTCGDSRIAPSPPPTISLPTHHSLSPSHPISYYVTSAVERASFNNLIDNEQHYTVVTSFSDREIESVFNFKALLTVFSPTLHLKHCTLFSHDHRLDTNKVPSVAGRAVAMDTSSHWSAASRCQKTMTRYGLMKHKEGELIPHHVITQQLTLSSQAYWTRSLLLHVVWTGKVGTVL